MSGMFFETQRRYTTVVIFRLTMLTINFIFAAVFVLVLRYTVVYCTVGYAHKCVCHVRIKRLTDSRRPTDTHTHMYTYYAFLRRAHRCGFPADILTVSKLLIMFAVILPTKSNAHCLLGLES